MRFMKKTNYQVSDIAFAFNQVKQGKSIRSVCKMLGISESTYYNWQKKYDEKTVYGLRRLKLLENKTHALYFGVSNLAS